jgi:hypothetical protein
MQQLSPTKNGSPLEFEIPAILAERLQVYRNEIAPTVTGKRPDAVFVTPRSVAIQVDALYKAARAMMPQKDWTWLKSVKTRLHAASPSGPPAGPVITSVQLLDLGQQLMDESRPSPNRSIRMADAVKYPDGLMIASLAFIPIWPKN